MSNLANKKILLLVAALVGIVILLVFLTRPTALPKSSPPPVLTAPSPPPSLTPVGPPAGKGAGFESEEYKQAELEYIKQYPILQKLPAQSPFFSIEYADEQHLIIHSKTDDKKRDYQAARNWLVENNIDYEKIQLEYK